MVMDLFCVIDGGGASAGPGDVRLTFSVKLKKCIGRCSEPQSGDSSRVVASLIYKYEMCLRCLKVSKAFISQASLKTESFGLFRRSNR